MPTYDYACQACGHKWEIEQRMTEDPVKRCPKCKKLKAQRQITGGNFILKGGGWYSDLYHKPAAKKSSGEGGESKSESSSSSSDAKSETKTESKSESKPESARKTETKSAKKAD